MLKNDLKNELSASEDLYKHWQGVDSIFTLAGLAPMLAPHLKTVQVTEKALASPGISEHLTPFIPTGKPGRYHIIK